MDQASSVFSTGVPALAAIPQLAGNSPQGFGHVASRMYWASGWVISSNTLGIKESLYDGDAGSRSTGKERDTESGNDYFGARFYSSNVGRFLSPDWSNSSAPIPYAKLDNPQSLNLYAYVQNNAESLVDADGHMITFAQYLAGEGPGGSLSQVANELEADIVQQVADDIAAENTAQAGQGQQSTSSNVQNQSSANSSAQQQSGTVAVTVGQRPIQNKWAQFLSILFTFHKAYHSYYRLTGDDGVTHQFEVLGESGSSHNQQVRDTYGTTRQSNGGANHEHTVYATEAQASALINRSEYFESHPCPVCTGGQEGYNLVFHNSNSYVYNMLSGAPGGGIPVPAAPFLTPGYARRPDDWY